MRNLTVVLIGLLFFSCEPKEEVDLIVHNATIYTVDENFSKASTFAVNNGVFTAVSQDDLSNYNAKEIYDAEGKTIVPGLIDAHCHFYGLGLNQQIVNLRGTESYQAVLDSVSEFQKKKPSSFIQGRGWDQNDWAVKEFPTKKALDKLFPNTPVALERVDGHAYLVNQKALDMAGITNKTIIEGGEIVKDANNQLTGVLVDNPMTMIDAVIPNPNKNTQIQALKDAEKICLSYGLTTVNDAGLNKSTIELIDSLQQASELNIRVYAMISNNDENLDYYLNKGIVKTDKLNVRSVKVYGDGALGSRGATLREPYTDKPKHFGAMVTPVEAIENLAERIAATDYQMNTHAIGDSANIAVLRAYSKALFGNGIIPSIQPTHATSDMYWAEDRLGEERIKGAYAYKTLLNNAGRVVLGTDFPVERVSPFLTFYAAVSRQDLEQYPKDGFLPEEALSREETLKGMTIWAAYSNFEEEEKGSIEVGKKADFVILSDDIMQMPISDIPNLKAEKVFISGVAY